MEDADYSKEVDGEEGREKGVSSCICICQSGGHMPSFAQFCWCSPNSILSNDDRGPRLCMCEVLWSLHIPFTVLVSQHGSPVTLGSWGFVSKHHRPCSWQCHYPGGRRPRSRCWQDWLLPKEELVSCQLHSPMPPSMHVSRCPGCFFIAPCSHWVKTHTNDLLYA